MALMDSFMDDVVKTIRIKKIFERYCSEGKRPTKKEAEQWLMSEGWNSNSCQNLLREWGYEEEKN